jgi:hypothetical protein
MGVVPDFKGCQAILRLPLREAVEMNMGKRQNELERQRQQRQTRAYSYVSANPAHRRLSSNADLRRRSIGQSMAAA